MINRVFVFSQSCWINWTMQLICLTPTLPVSDELSAIPKVLSPASGLLGQWGRQSIPPVRNLLLHPFKTPPATFARVDSALTSLQSVPRSPSSDCNRTFTASQGVLNSGQTPWGGWRSITPPMKTTGLLAMMVASPEPRNRLNRPCINPMTRLPIEHCHEMSGYMTRMDWRWQQCDRRKNRKLFLESISWPAFSVLIDDMATEAIVLLKNEPDDTSSCIFLMNSTIRMAEKRIQRWRTTHELLSDQFSLRTTRMM
jgi:hypothetical protein